MSEPFDSKSTEDILEGLQKPIWEIKEKPMESKGKEGEAKCCLNTNKEIYREKDGDFYSDSIFVTENGGIGFDCGGYVIVKPLRVWFELAGGKKNFDTLESHYPKGEE
jgi:hypothetical protein